MLGAIVLSPMMQALSEPNVLPLPGGEKPKMMCFSASQDMLVQLPSQLGIPSMQTNGMVLAARLETKELY